MKKILFSASVLLLSFVLIAQEVDIKPYGESGFKENSQYVITRLDGFEYIGEILSDDGHELLIDTKKLGKLYVPKFEIKSIIEVSQGKSIIYDAYQPAGPFTTRYSFTTNALPIKKGENYGMLNLYGPEVHFAVTDRLNMGVMSTWIASPLIFATKYSFTPKESSVNFSFGTLLGTSGYLNNFRGYGGLHWLNVTFGNRINNINFSGGYAYLQTGFTVNEPEPGVYTEEQYSSSHREAARLLNMTQGPIFSVASLFKIGGKASFIFDSMIGYFSYQQINSDSYYTQNQELMFRVTENDAKAYALFIMPGVRFQKSESKAFQICVAGVSMFGDSDVSFPIPMVSWFYKF